MSSTIQHREVVIMKQIIVDNISTNYYITEDGRCYNSKTGKYLKGQTNHKNGYVSFNITLPDGKKKRLYSHRLVALNYIENPHNKKEVNHKNGDKQNNCVDNLEWVTSKENKQHGFENELYKGCHVFCFNKNKELVAEYKTINEAARAVGISISQINQEIHKSPKALANGFYWSDKNELGETIQYTNTGKAKPVNQYTKEGKYLMTYPSTGAAARALSIGSSHIGECCRGKIKSYKGYVWRYVEDIVSPSCENKSAPQAQ